MVKYLVKLGCTGVYKNKEMVPLAFFYFILFYLFLAY